MKEAMWLYNSCTKGINTGKIWKIERRHDIRRQKKWNGIQLQRNQKITQKESTRNGWIRCTGRREQTTRRCSNHLNDIPPQTSPTPFVLSQSTLRSWRSHEKNDLRERRVAFVSCGHIKAFLTYVNEFLVGVDYLLKEPENFGWSQVARELHRTAN